MAIQKDPLVIFLKEVLRRKKLLPSQFASKINISHTTVSRWLNGKDRPNIRSCRLIADYSGESLDKVLFIAGYLPKIADVSAVDLPDFNEYARRKYPDELDEDLISMIEDLIERRKSRRHGNKQY